MVGLRISNGLKFLLPGLGGGSSISLTNNRILSDATGAVSSLTTTLGGAVTFSKVSGPSNVTVSNTGVVTATSALGINTVNLVVRVQNDTLDAVERLVTIVGYAPEIVLPPVPTPTIVNTMSNSTLLPSEVEGAHELYVARQTELTRILLSLS